MKYLILILMLFACHNTNGQCKEDESIFLKRIKNLKSPKDYENLLDSLQKFESTKCKSVLVFKIICQTHLERYDKAYEEIENLKKVDKSLTSPNIYTIDILVKQKKKSQALKEIEICLKNTSRKEMQIAFLQRRISLWTCNNSNKECEEKYNDLNDIYLLDPQSISGLANLIKFEIRIGKKILLDEHISDLMKLDNGTFLYYDQLSLIYSLLKDYQKGLELSRYLIHRFPNASAYTMNLGMNLLYLKQYDSALFYLDKAIEMKPTSSLAWNNKGFAKMLMGQFESAIPELQKSIELNNKDPHPYNNLGYVYSQLGGKENLELAKKYYQLSLDLGGEGYEPYWKY